MKFEEHSILFQRNNNDDYYEDVESLLVGETAIAEFSDEHDHYGYWFIRIFPAWYKGEKSWLVDSVWSAAHGYSAEMSKQKVISFLEGVELLLKIGAFEHIFKNEKEEK